MVFKEITKIIREPVLIIIYVRLTKRCHLLLMVLSKMYLSKSKQSFFHLLCCKLHSIIGKFFMKTYNTKIALPWREASFAKKEIIIIQQLNAAAFFSLLSFIFLQTITSQFLFHILFSFLLFLQMTKMPVYEEFRTSRQQKKIEFKQGLIRMILKMKLF